VALAAGDQVSLNITVANDGFLASVGDNGPAKWSSALIVGRGSHTIPSGSEYGGTWVGP
jgi:hypothetical protein